MSRIRPPALSPQAIATLIKDIFPFDDIEEDSIKELVSYNDRNYYFRGNRKPSYLECSFSPSILKQKVFKLSPNEYVIKIMNQTISSTREVINGLTSMKKFLYSRGLNVPYPITSLQGPELVMLTKSQVLAYETEVKKRLSCCNNDTTVINNEDAVILLDSETSIPIDEDIVIHAPREESVLDEPCELEATQYCVRVLTFLPGEILHEVPQTPSVIFKVGEYLGHLHSELQNFSHTGLENRQHLNWDLKYLQTREKYIDVAITDPIKYQNVMTILNYFEHYVMPQQPLLQQCIIHGDTNDWNIIITENNGELEVNGFVDFNDCALSPVVFDLGIAMVYPMLSKPRPLEVVVPMLSGYLQAFPLSDAELNLLYYVVLGRLSQSCVNGEYNYLQEPYDYLLVAARPAWALMEELLTKGKEECDRVWSQAKGKTLDDYIE